VSKATSITILAVAAGKERTFCRARAALRSRELRTTTVGVGMLKSATGAKSATAGGFLEFAQVVATTSAGGRGIGALGATVGRSTAGGGGSRRGRSRRRAAGQLSVHLVLEGSVNAAGVFASGHTAGLAAIAAMLEALATRAVAALREPKLVRKRRELAVLGGDGSLGHERARTGGTASVTVVVLLLVVTTITAGAVHCHTFCLSHFSVVII